MVKKYEATNSDVNFHIKHNSISNISLNLERYVSDKYYDSISTIDKNSDSEYYLVKRTSKSYTWQSSQKLE